MQGYQASALSQASGKPFKAFASHPTSVPTIFTPKRFGLSMAGALLFAGTVAALNTGSTSSPRLSSDSAKHTQTPQATPADSSVPPALTAPQDNTAHTQVDVTVNGQPVTVPENGTVTQTSQDGTTQTTVTSSSSRTGGGSGGTTSSTHLQVTATSSTGSSP